MTELFRYPTIFPIMACNPFITAVLDFGAGTFNRTFAVLIAVSVACFSATSILSEDIVRDYNRSFDFSALKTYRWMDAEKRLIARANPQTASLMSDEELDEIIRAAVDEELKKRGFTLATEGFSGFSDHLFRGRPTRSFRFLLRRGPVRQPAVQSLAPLLSTCDTRPTQHQGRNDHRYRQPGE